MRMRPWRLVSVCLVLILVAALAPSVWAGAPTIDLQTDANRDGIPDALAAEVDRVARSPDKLAAIAELVKRLPYAPETRALQERAAQLQARLARAQDDQEAQRILGELRSLGEQMMADPNYARTVQSLTTMFAPSSGRPAPAGGSPSSVRWGDLRRGHIMLVRSGLWDWFMFIYAMWYSHAGNYDGNSLVYESNTDGVRLKPLSKWQQPGQYIGLGYDNQRSEADVQGALNWAEGFYGTDGRTPYNYFYPDKWTDSRLYCSQLTWKIHNHLGVNLDSNAWQYQLWIAARWGWWAVYAVSLPAVAPDEVGLDGDVTMYSTGWN